MPKTRRVAVAIELAHQARHHFDIIAGIQSYARERAHWQCVIDPFMQPNRRGDRAAKYHGVIARASLEMASQAAKAGLPIVNVWSASPAKSLPTVLPDFRAGANMALEHLLARGYRRFAFQGYLRHGGTRAALPAFKAVLRAAKCPWTTQLISLQANQNARNWPAYAARLEQWIGAWKPPLGVLAIHDELGRNLANACLQAGLRIPDDVAIISFGNEPLICSQLEPTLSSINLGYDRVGYEAASLLDRLMSGKSAPKTPILIEPTELISRHSTESYAVDNPLVRQSLTFIAAHSHEDIRVESVAERVGTSLRSLERYFSESLGRTMIEEIARLRLERAKRLLMDGDETIKRIAHAAGYSDADYFIKVFRKTEGVAPGEYRRRRRR